MSDIEEDYRKLVLDPNFIASRGHLATMLERNTALRAENERLRAALERMLLEFDFLIEDGVIPDMRDDIIFVDARAALEENTHN